MNRTDDEAGPLAVLARVRRQPAGSAVPGPAAAAAPGERCELCGEAVAEVHGHVVDLTARSLRCACRPCWLLFTASGAGGSNLRAVPERVGALPGLDLSARRWDELQIPVSIAFFLLSSATGVLSAFYPSPAGATESQLPLDAWDGIVAANPPLASMEPDVEALLVRVEPRSTEGAEGWIVPIDACYELVGRLRRRWRGFDGGAEVRAELDAFFTDVRRRARVVT